MSDDYRTCDKHGVRYVREELKRGKTRWVCPECVREHQEKQFREIFKDTVSDPRTSMPKTLKKAEFSGIGEAVRVELGLGRLLKENPLSPNTLPQWTILSVELQACVNRVRRRIEKYIEEAKGRDR